MSGVTKKEHVMLHNIEKKRGSEFHEKINKCSILMLTTKRMFDIIQSYQTNVQEGYT